MKWILLLVVSFSRAELLEISQFSITEFFPGEKVEFPFNQKSYLRIHYNSLQPIRFLIKTYFQGKEVESPYEVNPQVLYPEGEGESLAWLSFSEPANVDQIMVESLNPQLEVMSRKVISVHWSWSEKLLAKSKTLPDWVRTLGSVQQQMIRDQMDKKAESEKLLESRLIDIISIFCFLYLLAQIYAFKQARGSWRKRTLAPLFLFIPTIVFLFMDQGNLSTILIFIVSSISLFYLIILYVWFKLTVKNHTH